MAKKGKRKAKAKSKTQALLNNKILMNIIMDKFGKKSRAKRKSKSKSKSKRTEPGHLPVQNQLAYINNLSLMDRVQPKMFLASNMQRPHRLQNTGIYRKW